ncbi:MAG: phosphodiester glycosidase family protein, partial [Bacteroidota bacterium]|nr:phosphodiester glycosidase family protein [Bacteroidota bacterium]
LVVVNGTFFSFETNRNLNVVVKDSKLVSNHSNSVEGKGKDTLTFRHPFSSAIGINKKREADVAWILADSMTKKLYASQWPLAALKDSVKEHTLADFLYATNIVSHFSSSPSFHRWKMKTAIGGGPVLLQNGSIQISNEEELKFTGKAINDKHPRTAMGYTKDNKLIILVIEGRNKVAHGATLNQEAQILKDLGCVEALNLDGGGSSCLLVNGKETITPADKGEQRAVPAVFMIKRKT